MAKSGTIVVTDGEQTPIGQAVLKPTPVIMTLGAVAANALGGSNSPEVLIVDLTARQVLGFADAQADTASGYITAAASSVIEAFTQDDDTARLSGWTASKGSDLAPISDAAAKPVRSLAALLTAIEDYVAANPSSTGRVIAVDQKLGKVSVFPTVPGPIAAMTADVQVDQTVTTTTSTIKNAFE